MWMLCNFNGLLIWTQARHRDSVGGCVLKVGGKVAGKVINIAQTKVHRQIQEQIQWDRKRQRQKDKKEIDSETEVFQFLIKIISIMAINKFYFVQFQYLTVLTHRITPNT